MQLPRVTTAEWRATGRVARWLVVSRAPVLVMTICSAALGGLVAVAAGTASFFDWLACTAGLVLAHAANNQLNDLTDAARGVDTADSPRARYGVHVLAHGLVTRAELTRTFLLTVGAALAVGVWLFARVGAGVLVPLALGAFFLLGYTHPLKRLGAGEAAVLIVWGPLMTAGASYVTSGGAVWTDAAWIGAVYALAPTAVIFGKHIDKAAFDEAKGVRTLPVRLGAARARAWVIAMVALQYAGVAGLIGWGVAPWTLVLTIFAWRDACRLVAACRTDAPRVRPAAFPESVWPLWYAPHAFAYARSVGALFLVGFAAGFALDVAFRAWLPA